MIVTRALPADSDLLRLHRHAPARYPLLLQSTSSSLHAGHAQGRWDLLLAASGESLRLDPDGRVRDHDGSDIGDDFLALLDARWRALRNSREDRAGRSAVAGRCISATNSPNRWSRCCVCRGPRVLAGGAGAALSCAVLHDHATGECSRWPSSARKRCWTASSPISMRRMPRRCPHGSRRSRAGRCAPVRSPPASRGFSIHLAAGDVFQSISRVQWRPGASRSARNRACCMRVCARPARRRSAGLFAGGPRMATRRPTGRS